jgi:hypothetical protein
MALLKFWLNAFIPRDVPGYTKVVPTGKHMNKTAIPLPGIARFWPGNTFKSLDACYLTDQRGFSDGVTANSRMHCEITVEIRAFNMVGQSHWSSGTTEVNISTGDETGFKKADMSRCQYLDLSVGPAFGYQSGLPSTWGSPPPVGTPPTSSPPPRARFKLTAAAGDPLVGMAADIDYNGILSIDLDPGTNKITVSFEGKIDAFPAYDCYAMYNNVTKTVFTNSPPPGNTVANLLGNANRPVSGSVTFP